MTDDQIMSWIEFVAAAFGFVRVCGYGKCPAGVYSWGVMDCAAPDCLTWKFAPEKTA